MTEACYMGNEHSSSRRTSNRTMQEPEPYTEMTEKERSEIEQLRELIRNNKDVFLLNNLLLSVRLFKHYTRDTYLANKNLWEKQEKYNGALLPEKVVIVPDLVRELTARSVHFNSYVGSELTVEQLKPTKIYVVYDNVIVQDNNESKDYSNPEELCKEYTFSVKEADLIGYVRLELIGNDPRQSPKYHTNGSQSESDIYSSIAGSSEYSIDDVDNTSIYNEMGAPNSDTSSTYEEEARSNNMYWRTEELQQRIKDMKLGTGSVASSGYGKSLGGKTEIESSTIPESCFCKITYTPDGEIFDPQMEKTFKNSTEQFVRKAKFRHNYTTDYIKSSSFARNFHKVFKYSLKDKMSLDDDTYIVPDDKKLDNYHKNLRSSSLHLQKVHYDPHKNRSVIERYEITPCFVSSWPQWKEDWRNRRSRTSWPTPGDICKVVELQCYLIPEYQCLYKPETDVDKSQNLVTVLKELGKCNWNICFPTAERYLESQLSSTQMTIYAVALAMHKDFMRFDGLTRGLSTSHIRNALFWAVENHPFRWSERDLGMWMIKFLKKLRDCVSDRHMSDYFIEERNVFQNVEPEHLLISQQQLDRIMQNPVMYMFCTLEKIEYTEDDSYPRLNFSHLLKLLTFNSADLEYSAEGYVSQRRNEECQDYFSRIRQQQYSYEVENLDEDRPSLINQSTNKDFVTNIQVECQKMTKKRVPHLLHFFAEHFLKMAEKSHELCAPVEKNMYLHQARLLALLLFEHEEWQTEANTIIDVVNMHRLADTLTAPDLPLPPETPKRNVSITR